MTSHVCSKCDCVKGCEARSEPCAIRLAECVGSGQVSPKQIEEHRGLDAAPAVNLKFGPEDFGIPAVYAAYAENYANWKAIAQPSQALQVITRLLQVHEGRKPKDALKIAVALIAAQPQQSAPVQYTSFAEHYAENAVGIAIEHIKMGVEKLEAAHLEQTAEPKFFRGNWPMPDAAIAQPKDKP